MPSTGCARSKPWRPGNKAALFALTPDLNKAPGPVEARPEREQARRRLRTRTDLQCQAVTLASCRVLTYRQVALGRSHGIPAPSGFG
ncbi:hypothetical protein ACIRBZ_33400 [Streptomyces sp. NPDC094038]|uniref:hypothetical protein n=1 Tax=Streptomyces sp. NPDC094038 TaxID=3366055 RepID=UPI003814FBAF